MLSSIPSPGAYNSSSPCPPFNGRESIYSPPSLPPFNYPILLQLPTSSSTTKSYRQDHRGGSCFERPTAMSSQEPDAHQGDHSPKHTTGVFKPGYDILDLPAIAVERVPGPSARCVSSTQKPIKTPLPPPDIQNTFTYIVSSVYLQNPCATHWQ